MKNKILALVVLSLIVSMALGACSAAPAATTAPQPTDASTAAPTQAPTQAPTAAPTAAPTQASAPSTSGRVQIRWFVGLGTGSRPDQQDAQKAVVAQFNASQDKIELVLEVANYDSARDVLSTEIASGNGPDIVGPVGWLGSNSFYGQWLDLAPYIQKNNYDFSDFDPATVKMYQTADQGTVGIPFAVYPAAIFYQTKMFDEAGLAYPPTTYGTQYTMPDGTKVPWNWDTLAKIAKLLTVDKNGKDATQSGFDPNSIVQYGYDPVYQDLFHFAGFWGSTKPYSGDSKGSYKANIPDNWKAAWKFWFDGIWGSQPFIPSGAVEKSADFGSGNAFNSGKIAMSITHSWYLTYAGQAGKSYDLAVLPADAKGAINGRIDADTFRIWKGTKHPDEAFQVLSYLLGDGASKLLQVYGAMPARKTLLTQWYTDQSKAFPWIKNWNIFTLDMAYPDIPSNEGWMPNFNEAWNRTITFKTLLQTDKTIDYDAEFDKFVNDMTAIFNK
jgi:multiple sugar transport system substrate-binding protein